MSIDRAAGGSNFDMGRVISSTFGLVTKHAMVLFPAALAYALISQGISAYALMGVNAADPTSMFTSPLYWISLLVAILGGFVFQGYVIHAIVDGYRGNTPTIGGSFAAALKGVLPLIATGLLVFIVSYLGLFLIVVPGIILFVMWSVAVPVVVVEGVGPLKAMGRSRALTKGARWPIFGLGLITIIIVMVLTFAIYGFNITAMAAGGQSFSMGRILAGTIVGTITSVLMYAGIAAIYSELRMTKEGVANDQLAEAFD
jgi:hypothetical protein